MNIKEKKIKILLVDNDEMMRIYFKDIFWMHGNKDTYEVDIASSLKEAREKIKNDRPDILFLDILLPVEGEDNSIDGQVQRSLSFIEEIKNEKNLSNIKVIIFSKQKENMIKEEINKMLVDGYLVKGELMPKEIISFVDKIHEPNNKN